MSLSVLNYEIRPICSVPNTSPRWSALHGFSHQETAYFLWYLSLMAFAASLSADGLTLFAAEDSSE